MPLNENQSLAHAKGNSIVRRPRYAPDCPGESGFLPDPKKPARLVQPENGDSMSEYLNTNLRLNRRGHSAGPRRVPTIDPPPPADPEEPFDVARSHLVKIELGKSSSSCKLSLVTRLHRTSKLQEFWCASFEEACVYENLAAHPDVVNFAEQLTRVDYLDDAGAATHTRVDAHVLLRNGEETLVSVKYDEKARRRSYLSEVASIARQTSRAVADRFTVLSRFSFHPVYRACARDVHHARRGWDPEADRIVLDAASELPETFTLGHLVKHARLEARGRRAAVRLIGDGDLRKNLLDPFADSTACWRAAS